MTNPITDLLALRRAPAALAADLTAITDAIRSVRTIETMLASLLAALDPLLTDVERLRKTVEPQQKRVAHIEQMMLVLEQRTAVIETTLLRLASDADQAIRALPDPDDDRGALTKAKDAIAGG
jgi:type VI protein secretion system component VasF